MHTAARGYTEMNGAPTSAPKKDPFTNMLEQVRVAVVVALIKAERSAEEGNDE